MSSQSGAADLVVFGPPGTGKTTFLVEQARAAPGLVTFCSHTKTAARTALRMAGSEQWEASTVHSLCFRSLGLSRAQVVSDTNLRLFAKQAGFMLGTDEDKPTELRFFLHALSYSRNTNTTPDQSFEVCGAQGSRSEYSRFIEHYTEWKEAFGFVDYTDMLQLVVDRGLVARLGTLVVDEAQDLSPLQWRVVARMSEVAERVIVAGDDDQAIYQWAGADPHGMVQFADSRDCRVTVLSQSYRVPRAVHTTAHHIAGRMRSRQHKEYMARDADGHIDQVQTLTKQALRDLYKKGSILMLFRNRYSRGKYERLLLEECVPYVTETGSSPLQRKGGKAFVQLRSRRWHEPNDVRVIRSGLTASGLEVAEAEGYSGVLGNIDAGRAGDMLNLAAREVDYMMAVRTDARPVDLRTIHSSKGMEAESVIVISSMTPSTLDSFYRDADAEHRVAYVAATRARSNLLIVNNDNAYPYPTRS